MERKLVTEFLQNLNTNGEPFKFGLLDSVVLQIQTSDLEKPIVLGQTKLNVDCALKAVNGGGTCEFARDYVLFTLVENYV